MREQEQDIIINVLDQYPLLDSYNIYKIIESMIYKEVEEEYEDGTLKCKYTLRFGEKHGLLQTWRKVKGRDLFIKYKEGFYKNGKFDGVFTRWFDNGNIMEKNTYRDGKRDGLHQQYYYNGQIELDYTYKDNKPDGVSRRWYRGADNSISDRDNGQLEEESPFKNGQQKGVYKRWNRQGKLVSTHIYK